MMAPFWRRLVLNAPPGPREAATSDVAEALQRGLLRLVARHPGAEGGVDYAALRASPDFRDVEACARRLAHVDVAGLGSRSARLAFWINVYNALVLHGIVRLGIRRTVWEAWNFFGRVSYRVGAFVLSVDEIEHGILRGNRRRRLPPVLPFRPGDPRLGLVIDPVDPRIHFAVNCGSRSCPPVAVYRADAVEAQLDLAARGFINQEVGLDARGRIECTRLLKWYGGDFEAAGGLGPFLLRHLDDGPARAALAAGAPPCEVFRPYSWSVGHRLA
jgi:hypothetical protein